MAKRSKSERGKSRRGANARQEKKFARYMSQDFRNLKPSEIVEEIRRGNNKATQAIICVMQTTAGSDLNSALQERLVKVGFLDALLDLLQDCGTKTFEQVLSALPPPFKSGGRDNDDDSPPPTISSGEQYYVTSPTIWTNVLTSMITPSTTTIIIPRLQALMECMCHPQQQFFKSHKEWLTNLPIMVDLLCSLVSSSTSPEAVTGMLQDDKITAFLTQCLCVRQCRPDIVEEITNLEAAGGCVANPVGILESSAAHALREFVHSIQRDHSTGTGMALPSAGVERLTSLANTVASFPSREEGEDGNNEANNQEGLQTLATCLVDVIVLAMAEGHDDSTYLQYLFYILQLLCVTKVLPVLDVVPKLIHLGCSDNCDSKNQAVAITQSIYNLVRGPIVQGQMVPNDDLCALAIETGIIEMILGMIVSFGAFDPEMTIMLKGVWNLVVVGGARSKTNTAIWKRAPVIRANIEAALRGGTISSMALEKIHLIQSILQKNLAGCSGSNSSSSSSSSSIGSKNLENVQHPCGWCQTENSGKNRCSKCQQVFYCSRECQVKDWKEGGHKQECKHIMAMMAADTERHSYCSSWPQQQVFRGNATEGRRRLKEMNIQLWAKSARQVMAQATLQGFRILDCVPVFDFRISPPKITLQLASEFLKEYRHEKDEAIYGPTRTVIERVREKGSLAVVFRRLISVDGQETCSDSVQSFVLPSAFKTFDDLQKHFSLEFFEILEEEGLELTASEAEEMELLQL